MAKPAKKGKDEPLTLLDRALGRTRDQQARTKPGEKDEGSGRARPSEPKPSLETIGMTKCSVCGQEVSVMLTRTHHPFTACGRCGARTFYNSAVAIALLKKRLRKVRL